VGQEAKDRTLVYLGGGLVFLVIILAVFVPKNITPSQQRPSPPLTSQTTSQQNTLPSRTEIERPKTTTPSYTPPNTSNADMSDINNLRVSVPYGSGTYPGGWYIGTNSKTGACLAGATYYENNEAIVTVWIGMKRNSDEKFFAFTVPVGGTFSVSPYLIVYTDNKGWSFNDEKTGDTLFQPVTGRPGEIGEFVYIRDTFLDALGAASGIELNFTTLPKRYLEMSGSRNAINVLSECRNN
jgi:hypothetical protein